MKPSRFAAMCFLFLLAVATCTSSFAQKAAMQRAAGKDGADRGEDLILDVAIAFSRYSGYTVTDENGTYYNFWGYCCYENKVYPPEYWGVFPLYFFGDTVGIGVDVRNECDSRDANLRVTTECYCLRTDGSNGAELHPLKQMYMAVPRDDAVSFDASFKAQMVEGAESGLDRFLVKLYHAIEQHEVGGIININPNNSDQNEFELTLPDGTTVTRDDLHDAYPGYVGPATSVHVKPKGNSNQNGLLVDGEPYPLVNANTYDITAASMTVNLYNDHINGSGKAMGRWWIAIEATGAEVSCAEDGDGSNEDADDLILVKEGVFCPPEADEAITEILDTVLGQ